MIRIEPMETLEAEPRQLALWDGVATARAADLSADELAQRLTSLTGRFAVVRFTENRATMLSFRQREGRLQVRVHRAFASASEVEILALARYLTSRDREAGRMLDTFLRQTRAAVATPSRPAPLRTQGRFFDLAVVHAQANTTYFHGACTSRITWGSAGSKRYRRSIQLGCYVRDDHLIRVHPSLDQDFVPRYYVDWIVFHELLHEVFGVDDVRGGRRSLHPPEFRACEESHPAHGIAKRWEHDNLHRLLRYRPR